MGEADIKMGYGPMSVNLARILHCLQKEGKLEKTEREHYNYKQRKDPTSGCSNTGLLHARDNKHFNRVLARLSDMNAKEQPEYSHHDIPWRCAGYGEPIPYETVFYRNDRFSVSESDDAC